MLEVRVLKEGFCRGAAAGIDEAGRGSLVGSMYMALVALTPIQAERLSELGVRDSKKLAPSTRENLYDAIIEEACLALVLPVPPALIDQHNLNRLEERGVELLVRATLIRVEPSRILVDLVGSAERIEAAVRRTGFRGEVVVEPEADEKYVEVGAASIVAKVLRDREIKKLTAIYGDLGSGYPSDPRTRRWVEEYYRLHGSLAPEVRRSWRTLKHLAPGEYRSKARGPTLLDYIQ